VSGALELESEEVRFKIEKKGTEADGNVEYDVQDVLPKKVSMVNHRDKKSFFFFLKKSTTPASGAIHACFLCAAGPR
jgi:hypothetical protein